MSKRLGFKARCAGVLILGGAALAAWRLGWLGGPRPPRYSVVLISIDSLVRNRLGAYGHRAEYTDLPVSPRIDALAADALVFDDAWSTSSWTLPSHMALLTGLSDRSHGVEVDHYALDPLRRSLAQQFQDAGAVTAGYYSGPYLDPKYGFGRGFADYRSAMMTPEELARVIEEMIAQRAAAGLPRPQEHEIAFLRDRVSHWDVTSPKVNRYAEQFLQERAADRRPFFLFLHYFDTHYDYLPERAEPGLGKQFDPDYQGKIDGAGWLDNPLVRDLSKPPAQQRLIGERDLGHVLALYDAEIHWVDRHIGRVLDQLKSLGLWERTIVCVTADHGDEFFEHGSIGHRSTLFPELTSIPLLLRVPGQTPPGRRADALVRLYDLAPTLLDYAGLPPLAAAEGRSLRPLLLGTEQGPREVVQRMAGTGLPRDAWRDERFAVHRAFTVRQDGAILQVVAALHRQTGEPLVRVYDRREDPGELRPLAAGDPRYREALAAFRRAFLAAEEHARALPQSELALRRTPAKGQEEIAMLAELGYAGVEAGGAAPSSGLFPSLGPFPEP